MANRLTSWTKGDHAALLRGLAAYGSAELAVRLVRLGVVIIIARQLAPDIVGVAALALSLFELVRVLTNIGVGQQIIRAEAGALDALCNSAHTLFWRWCGLVALVQLAVAAVLGLVFDQMLAAWMLAVLALVYAWMPGGLVQCYLLMREGRASATARTAAIQTIADHLLTAALLLVWQSPWGIVLPKLLTAPIWLVLTRRARPWAPVPEAGHVPLRSLMGFGLSVLATDMMVAMRGQFDKLIIAASMGVGALGTYYFAFNAGIGILSSLVTAFGTVSLPMLCKTASGPERTQRLRIMLLIALAVFVPIIAAQSLLAEIYVPLIFGQHWAHAAPLIAILCLAGLPMLAMTLSTAWLRAEGRPHVDALAGTLGTLAALAGLWIGASLGSLILAAAMWVAGLALIALPFAARQLATPLRRSHPISQRETFA